MSKESLHKHIDGYCNKRLLKANVSKSAVMVFSVEDGWKWGEDKLPNVSSYTYCL